MDTAWDYTLIRDKGGSIQENVMSRRGAEALKKTMTTMRLEVPLLAMAE